MKPLRQSVEVKAPILGAIGGVVGSEMAAVKQNNDRTAAFFEVAGPDTIDIDEFFVLHEFPRIIDPAPHNAAQYASSPVLKREESGEASDAPRVYFFTAMSMA